MARNGSSTLVRRSPGLVLDDVFSMFDTGFPFGWKLSAGTHAIRVEDFLDEDHYVVRAELPGIDPDKDVTVTVEDGLLTITAERREEKRDTKRSEFHYGSFSRTVTLPAGAREDSVAARYENGMLEVSVALAPIDASTKTRTIPVQHS